MIITAKNNRNPTNLSFKVLICHNSKQQRYQVKEPNYLLRFEGVDFFAERHELYLLVAVDVLAELVNVVDDSLKQIFNKYLTYVTTFRRWMTGFERSI